MQNRIVVNKECIEIRCDRNDTETQALCGLIPHIHSNRIKTRYTTSVRNIAQVMGLFRGITVDNMHQMPALIQDIYTQQLKFDNELNYLIENGPRRSDPVLMRHQQLGREIAEVVPKYGFYYDTRTGKTIMSLQIIADDIKKHPDHKWLVLCPLILIENAWIEDASKFFPDLKIVSLHAPTKAKRLQQFRKDANVYVQNIESFTRYIDYIYELDVHGCFVDESSTMKSTKSKFGRAAVEYAATLERWYLLSGTPAPNGEWEYYRQLQSIDYYAVPQSYSKFKEYFFNNTSYNPQFEKLELKPERTQELKDLVGKYAYYVDKEDVLTTPGRDYIDVDIQMPETVKKHHKAMLRDMYLDIEKQGEKFTIVAPSAAAKLNKLRQISSGFIIDAENNTTHVIDMFKFNGLLELLTKLGNEQCIIWCNYKEEFRIIKKLLGDKCTLVYGEVGIQDKNKAIAAFKKGEVQYLVANPASADKGLTLTNAHICIYFSLTHSYEYFKQSKERIYGDISKQPKKCLYYILKVKGSMDNTVQDSLKRKQDASYAILNYIKKEGENNG